MKRMKFMNPYLAGVGIGLCLLASIYFFGKGVGASGAMMRSITTIEKAISPTHVNNNAYLAEMGGGDKNPLSNYLVFMMVGIILGGFLSGSFSGRFVKEINHGPRITESQRIKYALLGGFLFAVGARFARGCTSGIALSGGATLALGSWVTMLVLFAVAYIAAYFTRKLWI